MNLANEYVLNYVLVILVVKNIFIKYKTFGEFIFLEFTLLAEKFND